MRSLGWLFPQRVFVRSSCFADHLWFQSLHLISHEVECFRIRIASFQNLFGLLPQLWRQTSYYVLSNSQDIHLVIPSASAFAITTALAQNPHLTSLPLPKPDVLSPDGLSQNTPTAEIFRHPEVQAVITGDFLVLPCDLICELPGEALVEAWMMLQGGLGGAFHDSDDYKGPKMGLGGENGGRRGGLGVWFETKGEDSTKGAETDFVITTSLPPSTAPPPEGSLRPHISKVLYSTTTDTLRDITEEKKGFPIRRGLIRKHGRLRMLTTHRDAHIYLFPYWVLEMIKQNEYFDSISEDVVGWWAKAGWQDGLAEKLQLGKIFDPTSTSERNDGESGSHASNNVEDDIDLASMSSTYTSALRSSTKSAPTKITPMKSPAPSIPPMLSYIHPTGPSTPFIRRVDNSHLLLHTSLYLATLSPTTDPPADSTPSPFYHKEKISSTLIAEKTNIHAPTTLIAPNTTIATHAVIKSSVIGANCVIEAGVRLTGCLLMDGVTVGAKSVLQGCIVGRRAVVGMECNLRECEVQEGYKVEEGREAKGEKFMIFEGLEEGVEDEEGDRDEEGEMVVDEA